MRLKETEAVSRKLTASVSFYGAVGARLLEAATGALPLLLLLLKLLQSHRGGHPHRGW
jgi:hypothetical protein